MLPEDCIAELYLHLLHGKAVLDPVQRPLFHSQLLFTVFAVNLSEHLKLHSLSLRIDRRQFRGLSGTVQFKDLVQRGQTDPAEDLLRIGGQPLELPYEILVPTELKQSLLLCPCLDFVQHLALGRERGDLSLR